MKGTDLYPFMCPLCRGRLALQEVAEARCSSDPLHRFPLEEGAPNFFAGAPALASDAGRAAVACRAWVETRGGKWARERKRAWRHIVGLARAEAPPPGIFADLGAGDGGLAALAAESGYEAVALDAKLPGPGAYLRCAATFEPLPLADRSVRVAAFCASLHYAGSPVEALREVERSLAREGILILALTPIHESKAGAEAAAETARREIANAAPGSLLSRSYSHFTKAQLASALEGAGFTWEERGPGLSAPSRASRRAKEVATGSEFARFPLLLCRPAGGGGNPP